MANYNGARKKKTGQRNAYSQSSETGVKNKNYNQNSSGDGWGNTGRRPSNYTSDDLWGPLPSEPAVSENAWVKKDFRRNQTSHRNQGNKPVPLVGYNFSWDEDEYPALDSKQPKENVWEKRKEKLEGRMAMQPTNLTEEELMIQKAIELSKREAMEDKERRKQIEEEYALQNVILATNPEFFSDFLTSEDLAEASKSTKPEATEYQCNDSTGVYEKKESIWDIEKPDRRECSQKQGNKTAKKKKRNKSQSSMHMDDEVTVQNAWSDSKTYDQSKQNESMLPDNTEYQEIQDKWSQNPVNKSYSNKADKDESQYVDTDFKYSPADLTSNAPPCADNESKLHKDYQPKISKVIDMFGGWASKTTQNSCRKSSLEQEKIESNCNFPANSGSKNEGVFQDDFGKLDEMSKKYREDENFSINKNNQSSLNEEDSWEGKDTSIDQSHVNEDSWNNRYSSNNKQCNSELKDSLYSHVESNIAASASSSFFSAATNPSDLSKKSFSKDDDIMNSIVQDYASLAVTCTDSSVKEVPVQRKCKDIFNSVVPLLNEDNLNPNITDLQPTSVGEPLNLSIPVSNQASKSEITYSLNNTSPIEFSNSSPNENIAGLWHDSKIGFPTNPERNELNDSLFSSHISEQVKVTPNDLEDYHEAIPAPVQREAHFPPQPNPVIPNLMNPNLMMGMNPLLMQQMMMLNNPFFLQQLHQMQMYYRTLSMPFTSPLINPIPMPTFNPVVSSPIGTFPNSQPNSNMNQFPELSVETNSPIPPPSYNFENENLRSMPSKSDAPQTSAVPNNEFENSWLSDLLSEGEAHMDSFIPPPTMPGDVSSENPHPAPYGENIGGTNVSQNILESAYRNDTIPQKSTCDIQSLKQESSTLTYGRIEDVNANALNVNQSSTSKSSMPVAAKDSGWGDINDMPKGNFSSWNNDVDGWATEAATPSKSMINSSRCVSRKPVASRQPVRQPRQTSQWR